MDKDTIVPASQTGDEGKDPSQPITKIERTPEEIAAHNLKKKADDAKLLGLDPKKILGEESTNDEPPAWYKKEKSKEATATALQLAEAIADSDTKEKVKEYLNTRIVPSGDPERDFRDALGVVSAGKNSQIVAEMKRYTPARTIASGGSMPPTPPEEEFVPTEYEASMMKPPFNLTKEKILAARAKS